MPDGVADAFREYRQQLLGHIVVHSVIDGSGELNPWEESGSVGGFLDSAQDAAAQQLAVLFPGLEGVDGVAELMDAVVKLGGDPGDAPLMRDGIRRVAAQSLDAQ